MNRIYIGKKPCGCIVAATLDPDDLVDMAQRGLIIETVDRETVQVQGCQCNTDSALGLNTSISK